VVERSGQSGEEGGYMLGLYYLGTRVLHGLGLFEEARRRSVPVEWYEIRDGRGQLTHRYELAELTRRTGPVMGIGRPELIRLLREGLGDLPVRMETTPSAIRAGGREVEVDFDDGTSGAFDLVVGADGLHSATRDMVLSDDEYAYRETGWGGWVCWTDAARAPTDTFMECWGAGHFVGLYPTRQRLGLFMGGPLSSLDRARPDEFLAAVRAEVRPDAGAVADALAAVNVSSDTFFWDFHDCRCTTWRKGRVVLVGDAATGFLPTAGIGASMAMESAAVLADVLSRTDADGVERALGLYETRRRERVESAQETSRDLGKLMFVESPALAWGRNQLVKHYPLERFVRSLAELMDEPI
jgi:2-polyprenyl-6-methoxyphenol hydroxylase-like FAD-dependent oxidoreductase